MAILREDYHFSYPFMHWMFALAALLLLGASIWMILDDYYSPWKTVQKEGYKIRYLKQVDELKGDIAELKNEIQGNRSKIKNIQQDVLKRYQQTFKNADPEATVADLKDRLDNLNKELDNRESKRAKSNSILRQYRARQELHIREEGSPDPKLQKKITQQKTDISELEDEKEKKQKQVNRYQSLLEPVLSLERQIDSKQGQIASLEEELDAMNPDATPTQIRNAPILNFASPTVKPKQLVLEHIQDDYHYTTTRKVDRCQTCHINIDRPGYESVRDFDAYFDSKFEDLSNESIEKKVSAIDDILHERTGEPVVANSKRKEFSDYSDLGSWNYEKLKQLSKQELLSRRSNLLAENEEIWKKREKKFEEEGLSVYQTHPKLDLFLDANSPHPLTEHGCTICHKGRGRELNFARAAHTPSNEEEKKKWKKKYGWEKQEHWHKPMTPEKHMEASCYKCHKEQETVPFAEELNRGEKLVRRKGCYGCHNIEGFNDLPNPGPSLKKITTKLDKEWVYKWLREPNAFKHSRMPDFYGLTNDSAKGLGLEGVDDPSNHFPAFNRVEMLAVREYLWEQSEKPEKWESLPDELQADASRGEKLFEKTGCKGCHTVNKDFAFSNKEENWPLGYGFDLGTIAEKAAGREQQFKEWLYNWIRAPERYDEHARMPNLHLTKQQALDITQYIMTDEKFRGIRDKDEFEVNVPEPEENRSTLNEMISKQLSVSHPSDRVKRVKRVMSGNSVKNEKQLLQHVPDIRQIIEKYDDPYKRKLVWLGEQMIRTRGCANCHAINGLEDAGKVGASLTGSSSVGNKPLFMFSFGNLNKHKLSKRSELKKELREKGWLLEHNRWSWMDQKLKHPRSFNYGVPDLSYRSKLKMPKYEWAEGEREAIVTFLLGLTNREIPERLKVKPTGKEKTIEDGKGIARTKNCIGCHRVGTQLRDVVLRKPGEEKIGQEVTDGPLLQADMSRATFGRIMQANQDHPFLSNWRKNQQKSNLPWLGGYLFWNSEKKRAFYQLNVSEREMETIKKRGVTPVAEKGEYIDVDLLLKILKYGYDRIPVMAYAEGNIRMSGDLITGASPPSLKWVGKKIQSRWLFNFLKAPHKNIWRREMITNMPNYHLSDDEVLTISKYLYYRNDEKYPYESQEKFELTESERDTARKILFGATDEDGNPVGGQCQACHGNPSSARPVPSLLKTKNRTKRSWFEMGWLKRPRELEPGVVMNAVPALEDDEKEQAVIKYLYNLTQEEFHKQTSGNGDNN